MHNVIRVYGFRDSSVCVILQFFSSEMLYVLIHLGNFHNGRKKNLPTLFSVHIISVKVGSKKHCVREMTKNECLEWSLFYGFLYDNRQYKVMMLKRKRKYFNSSIGKMTEIECEIFFMELGMDGKQFSDSFLFCKFYSE